MALSIGRRAQVVSHVRHTKDTHGHQYKAVSPPDVKPFIEYLPRRERDVLMKYGLERHITKADAIELGTADEHTFDHVPNPHYVDFTEFEARAQLLDSEEAVTVLIDDLTHALHHED